MSITNPKTLEDLKGYIYIRLGRPVINVEIADIQLEAIICDSIAEFQRYNYGEGIDLVTTTLLVKDGVSEYKLKDDDGFEFAYDIHMSTGVDGINTLFSPTHTLLYNDWVVNRNYPGGGGYSMDGGGLILTGYEISMEYLSLVDHMLGKHYTIKYNRSRHSLVVTPTPEKCAIATIRLYKRTDSEALYSHVLIKKLVVARAKIQWGLQIGKYSITMPDGSTMNGFEIMNKGYEEEEKVLQDVRLESEPCDFFHG